MQQSLIRDNYEQFEIKFKNKLHKILFIIFVLGEI